jgi:hypothetical protein
MEATERSFAPPACGRQAQDNRRCPRKEAGTRFPVQSTGTQKRESAPLQRPKDGDIKSPLQCGAESAFRRFSERLRLESHRRTCRGARAVRRNERKWRVTSGERKEWLSHFGIGQRRARYIVPLHGEGARVTLMADRHRQECLCY